ncbi:MAG: hypothetical protein F4X72_14585 [Dehalococcoidia bacterium]|nr:hypothetical protein [Dehalococcoidia bacterium]
MLGLQGVNAKIGRASESLRRLETDIRGFCENQRLQLVREVQEGIHVVDSGPPELLINYSIRAGEIAYNLRSALDHLVWQLVQANGKTPDRRSEFPIFLEESEYFKGAKSKLKGTSRRQRELIASFQPFRSHNGIGPHLWMLHTICNIDKHRHLNVVNLHSFSTAHLEGEVGPELTHGQTGGLGLLTLLKGTERECKVKIDVVADVCFRDDELEAIGVGYGSEIEGTGLKRPPVVLALSSCLTAVKTVVQRLADEAPVSMVVVG